MTQNKPNFYTWPNPAFPFWLYYQDNNTRIFMIENVFHNYCWLEQVKEKIRPGDIFICQTGWYIDDYIAKTNLLCIEMLNLNIDQFYILCNCEEELQFIKKYGLNGTIINHNTWLDYEKFQLHADTEKQYDCLYIARPSKFKNHELLRGVNNLALVAGGNNHGNEQVDLPECVNDPYIQLDRSGIVDIINKSKCGLCLSEHEGACYTSSEYLLCGTPVVSVESKGGRDYWYNENNSIICKPTAESVHEAIEQALDRDWDFRYIREAHVNQIKSQRNKFITQVLEPIFLKYNVKTPAKQHFVDKFQEKMKQCDKIETVREIFEAPVTVNIMSNPVESAPRVIYYFRDVMNEDNIEDKSRSGGIDSHPQWFHLAVKKFKQFNPSITPDILTTVKDKQVFEDCNVVDLHSENYQQYFKTFLDKYENYSSNPLCLELFSISRHIEIANHIRMNDIPAPVIYIESDILVYDDVKSWPGLIGSKSFCTGRNGSTGILIINNLQDYYDYCDYLKRTWLVETEQDIARKAAASNIYSEMKQKNLPGGVSDPYLTRLYIGKYKNIIHQNIDSLIVNDAVIDWGIHDTHKSCKETIFHWDTKTSIDPITNRWLKNIQWKSAEQPLAVKYNIPYCYSHRHQKLLRQRTLGFHANTKLLIEDWFNH